MSGFQMITVSTVQDGVKEKYLWLGTPYKHKHKLAHSHFGSTDPLVRYNPINPIKSTDRVDAVRREGKKQQ